MSFCHGARKPYLNLKTITLSNIFGCFIIDINSDDPYNNSLMLIIYIFPRNRADVVSTFLTLFRLLCTVHFLLGTYR